MSRLALAIVVAVLGVAVVVALAVRQPGGIRGERVEVPDAAAAVLDTLRVQGRIVEASVNGWVVQQDPDGVVWVSSGGQAFPMRFPEGVVLEVEDHVLVTGRLRARGGRRWLAVTSWAHVETEVSAPPNPGP